MLPNKVESIQETDLLEQEEARISREFLALRKCHLNLKLLFLIWAESMAKQRAGRCICSNACSYWPGGVRWEELFPRVPWSFLISWQFLQKGGTSKKKVNGKKITKQTFPLPFLFGLVHPFIYPKRYLFSIYYILPGSRLGTVRQQWISPGGGDRRAQKIIMWQITWRETHGIMVDQGKAVNVD